MPKGKHAAALFEVIHTGKSTSRSVPAAQALRTPGWWFRRTPAGTPAAPRATAATLSAPDPAPSAADGIADRLRLDPDKHEISLRVSYTHAIIACFSVIVVVELSYLVGRHTGGTPAPVHS